MAYYYILGTFCRVESLQKKEGKTEYGIKDYKDMSVRVFLIDKIVNLIRVFS